MIRSDRPYGVRFSLPPKPSTRFLPMCHGTDKCGLPCRLVARKDSAYCRWHAGQVRA